MASYHDIIVHVNGAIIRIADSYGYELTCNKTSGWRLWWHPITRWDGTADTAKPHAGIPSPSNDKPQLIGGEFDSDSFRIEVNGLVVCGN